MNISCRTSVRIPRNIEILFKGCDKVFHSGHGVFRRYCLPEGNSVTSTPLGYKVDNSSFLTLGRTITVPFFVQSTGVATRFLSVSCIESITKSEIYYIRVE